MGPLGNHSGDNVMFKKIILAGCAAALLFGAVPSQASMRMPYQKQNGTSMNGLSLNGLSLNGLSLNGVKLNGMELNGLFANGVKLNGLFANGTEAGGTAQFHVVGAELPASVH
jgi:hypothetical protein